MPVHERQVFDDFIRAEGLKETIQRALVLDAFLSADEHVSAEDVYHLVNQQTRRVGFVTVYRTMKLIAGCGLAREVTFDDGIIRFEHAYGRQHHHHLICTNCKQVIEFTSRPIDDAENAILETHGFEARYHRYEIFGLCRKCRDTADGEQPEQT